GWNHSNRFFAFACRKDFAGASNHLYLSEFHLSCSADRRRATSSGTKELNGGKNLSPTRRRRPRRRVGIISLGLVQGGAGTLNQTVVPVARSLEIEHAGRQVTGAPRTGGVVIVFQRRGAKFVIVRIVALAENQPPRRGDQRRRFYAGVFQERQRL